VEESKEEIKYYSYGRESDDYDYEIAMSRGCSYKEYLASIHDLEDRWRRDYNEKIGFSDKNFDRKFG